MILLDVNLLIYAVNRDTAQHPKAKRWLESAISGSETVGLPGAVALAFLRLTTRPGLFRQPLRVEVAFDLLEAWLARPTVALVQPGAKHFRILRGLLTAAGTAGNLTSDAHLAALAIEHGATLYSSDSDFEKFPNLDWRNPLL